MLIVWGVVTCALLLYLLVASLLLRRRASRWRRETVLAEPVLVSPETGPALLGYWRPRIVVPRWFLDAPAATQALILEHERQHLRVRDPLLLCAAVLAVVIVPWNLLLWWQLRRLRLAIELDCDARVMRTGADAVGYGEVLLTVTQRAMHLPLGAVAMSEPVSALEQRIRCLVPAVVGSVAWRTVGALSLAVAGAAVAVALEAPAIPQQSAPRAQRPFAMPAVPNGGIRQEEMSQRLHAILERYPQIVTGPQRAGAYVAGVVFREDGSIHHSELRFTPVELASIAAMELSEMMPSEGRGSSMTYGIATALPGGGSLRNQLTLAWTYLPADYAEAPGAQQQLAPVTRPLASRSTADDVSPESGRLLPAARIFRELDASAPSMAEETRRLEARVVEALIETYPEILGGSAADAHYAGVVVLRPDGSVYRSALRLAVQEGGVQRWEQGFNEITSINQGRFAFGEVGKGHRVSGGRVLRNTLEFRYTVLPAGFDEARTLEAVQRAVLDGHSDLLLPVNAEIINRLTVFMTDDGRIDREKVEVGRRQDLWATGRPEDFDFSVLGIPAQQIGAYGMTTVRSQPSPVIDSPAGSEEARAAMLRSIQDSRMLLVRYAWPRRAAEPVGGMPQPFVPDDGAKRRVSAHQLHLAAQRALAARLFPEVVADPARFIAVRPWILLSHDGAVVRTGQAQLPPEQVFLASTQLGPQMPGVRFAEVESLPIPASVEQVVNLTFVWMAADSPLPPAR